MSHISTRVVPRSHVLPTGLTFLATDSCTEYFTLNGLMIMLFLGKAFFLVCYFCFILSLEQRRLKLGIFVCVCGLEDWETGKSDCSENYSINLQKEAKMKDGKSFWFLTVLQTMGSHQRPSYIRAPFGIHYTSLTLKDKYSYLVKLV